MRFVFKSYVFAIIFFDPIEIKGCCNVQNPFWPSGNLIRSNFMYKPNAIAIIATKYIGPLYAGSGSPASLLSDSHNWQCCPYYSFAI